VCAVNQTPFAVVRAISDAADGNAHIDIFSFVAQAVERSASILKTFAAGLI
jgi:nucleoside phosphorylase